MPFTLFTTLARRVSGEYAMLGVLLLLVAFFSVATLEQQQPRGADAAAVVARQVGSDAAAGVLIVAQPGPEEEVFARHLQVLLAAAGVSVQASVVGTPQEIRQVLEREAAAPPAWIATTERSARMVANLKDRVPGLEAVRLAVPQQTTWPIFLRAENLINVANQVVVFAIIAIGMTLVIITGGIDLSVGSLVALAAVVAAGLIEQAGGTAAPAGVMAGASLAAILLCGLVGLFSGTMITTFRLPPFIATLGVMLVASGLAYILSAGQSFYQVPAGYVWLGRGVAFFGLPNAVLLMLLLYAVAHVLMTRTTLGRYLYAVGGNAEAARLSGVRVSRILLFAYTLSGLMAGLGGIILASQLKSGAPTYGQLYELYVIAAVVVGGTSLSGGQGRILGTLTGALIIGVIQNGMNLTGVESYTQKVVLGLVILGAVLLDRLRRSAGS
jgi:ribose transport system permease protein